MRQTKRRCIWELMPAPELDHELANPELLPETLNRQKIDQVGERQLDGGSLPCRRTVACIASKWNQLCCKLIATR